MKTIACLMLITIFGAAYSSSIGSTSELTQCQSDRQRAEANPNPLSITPVCDENGDYAPLQCHGPRTGGKRPFCQCWDTNKDVLAGPSTLLETCGCPKKKREMEKSAPASERSGLEYPECEPSGHFKRKQCSGQPRRCRCVDRVTGERVRDVATDEEC